MILGSREIRLQIAFLAIAAFLFRFAAFGDPNMSIDESFYQLVGFEMRNGMVPYVDIWDRKPFGLFAIYWFFAAFPDPVIAYQLGAAIAALGTAVIIARMASFRTEWGPATLGGICYLAMLNPLGGQGGQGPVYYNLLVAFSAFQILRYRANPHNWRLASAMFALGLAITVKQTVFFEAVFFGLWAMTIHKSWRLALLSIALGALPFVLIGLWYTGSGYWQEFLQAMVFANLDRPPLPLNVIGGNGFRTAISLAPLAGVCVISFLLARSHFDAKFVGLWLVAAVAGFLSVPFLIDHYALPLLVPACLAASAAFSMKPFGYVLAGITAVYGVLLGNTFDVERHASSAADFERAAQIIRSKRSPNGELFLFDAPPLLYAVTGTRPMSVLGFPHHLSNSLELDTSHVRTIPELNRLIDEKPEMVIMAEPAMMPPDMKSFLRLTDYARSQCAAPIRTPSREGIGKDKTLLIYAHCNAGSVDKE